MHRNTPPLRKERASLKGMLELFFWKKGLRLYQKSEKRQSEQIFHLEVFRRKSGDKGAEMKSPRVFRYFLWKPRITGLKAENIRAQLESLLRIFCKEGLSVIE